MPAQMILKWLRNALLSNFSGIFSISSGDYFFIKRFLEKGQNQDEASSLSCLMLATALIMGHINKVMLQCSCGC